MLGVRATSDAQTSAARITRACVAPIEANDVDADHSPWTELMQQLAHEDFELITGMSAAAARARLASTPFKDKAAGLAVGPMREMCMASLWCFAYATSQENLEELPGPLLQALFALFDMPATWSVVWKATGILGIMNEWRTKEGVLLPEEPSLPRPRPLPPSIPPSQPPIPTTSTPTSGIMLPPPPIDNMQTELASGPWWMPPASAPAPRPDTIGFAQHNILYPYCLGSPDVLGSSIWQDLVDGGTFALTQAVDGGVDSLAPDAAAQRSALYVALQLYLSMIQNAEVTASSEEQATLKELRKNENRNRRTAMSSIASVPWLQRLRMDTSQALDPCTFGRRLAVAMKVDNENFTSRLQTVSRNESMRMRTDLMSRFKTTFEEGELAQALLVLEAFKPYCHGVMREAFVEARELADRFPKSIHLREMCAGRHQQLSQLPIMWAQATTQFLAVGSAHENDEAWLMGNWGLLIDGFLASTNATASVDAAIQRRGAAFGGGWAVGGAPRGAVSVGGGVMMGRGAPTGRASGSKGTVIRKGGTNTVGASAALPATFGASRLRVQEHSPVSRDIVGDEVGLEPPGTICWVCNKTGHYRGECSVEYGRLGRPLPGFDKNGNRKPGMWNDDTPKRATYALWVKFLQDPNNFPSGQAELPGLKGAPGIAEFQERALNASI